MNYKLTITLAVLIGLYGCQQETGQATATTQAEASAASAAAELAGVTGELGSGIDSSGFDTSVRPQDDFFDYVNGTWLEETEIPSDKIGRAHV